jgi:hypothetical protein
MKSVSLNLLEPSGPVQAYTGIALPLTKFVMGNNISYAINCSCRIAATLCTMEKWFVSDIYLHVPCIILTPF